MELLVCFKVVRDLDGVIPADWENAGDASFDIAYTKKIIGCYDESALELALCVADQAKERGVTCNVTALTIGSSESDPFLTKLYAVKFSDSVRISCTMDLRFNPRAVSLLIAHYISLHTAGFDAILLGCQAGAGDNAQTAALVAERLNLPCVNMVKDIRLDDRGFLVTAQIEDGIREAVITAPAVYAVGNSETHTYLRIPTLKEKLAASKCAPQILEIDKLGLNAASLAELADTEVLTFASARPQKNCIWLDAETNEEKARLLYEGYLREAVRR